MLQILIGRPRPSAYPLCRHSKKECHSLLWREEFGKGRILRGCSQTDGPRKPGKGRDGVRPGQRELREASLNVAVLLFIEVTLSVQVWSF